MKSHLVGAVGLFTHCASDALERQVAQALDAIADVVATLGPAKALRTITIGTMVAGLNDSLLQAISRAMLAIQQVNFCLYRYLCVEVEARFDTAA